MMPVKRIDAAVAASRPAPTPPAPAGAYSVGFDVTAKRQRTGGPQSPRRADGVVPFAPWSVFGAQRAEPVAKGGDARVHVMWKTINPPQGWVPRVQGLSSVPKELAKRQLEATRIVGALGRASIVKMIDEPWDTIRTWPRDRIVCTIFDVVVASAGAPSLGPEHPCEGYPPPSAKEPEKCPCAHRVPWARCSGCNVIMHRCERCHRPAPGEYYCYCPDALPKPVPLSQ